MILYEYRDITNNIPAENSWTLLVFKLSFAKQFALSAEWATLQAKSYLQNKLQNIILNTSTVIRVGPSTKKMCLLCSLTQPVFVSQNNVGQDGCWHWSLYPRALCSRDCTDNGLFPTSCVKNACYFIGTDLFMITRIYWRLRCLYDECVSN